MTDLLLNAERLFYQKKGAIFTAEEISRQPKVWREMAADMASRREEIRAFMANLESIPNLRLIFTGAGSSAFIGESVSQLLADEQGIKGMAIPTTDVVTTPKRHLPDVPTLMVSFSRSGESPESVGALTCATQLVHNLHHIVFVCKEDSSVAEYARSTANTLVLNMPPDSCDRGFAMTSSVSVMALAAWAVFGWRCFDERLAFVELLAQRIEQDMNAMDILAKTAAGWNYDRAVFLGSGALTGLAREGAVKMLELTQGQVNAGWDTPTGFRHGPKSVVREQTLTVHLMSACHHTRRYDEDLLREVLAEQNGNWVLTISDRDTEKTGADLDVLFSRPEGFPELGAYIRDLVFLQLLAMEKSFVLGVTTDDPCPGGQVNRVVQGVTIYPLEYLGEE